jgi:hypothetical protein
MLGLFVERSWEVGGQKWAVGSGIGFRMFLFVMLSVAKHLSGRRKCECPKSDVGCWNKPFAILIPLTTGRNIP